MREEVDTIVKTDGWSKEAMGKMRLVDSFMRETMRIAGLGASKSHVVFSTPNIHDIVSQFR